MEELTTSKADLEGKVAELGDALEESEAQVLRLNELLPAHAYPHGHACCYARGLLRPAADAQTTEKKGGAPLLRLPLSVVDYIRFSISIIGPS